MTCILPGDLGVLATTVSAWNPATAGGTSSPGMTFSNNNRTVTGGISGNSWTCKGSRSHGSGSYYFEVTASAIATTAVEESVGLVNGSWVSNGTMIGLDSNSWGVINNGTNYLIFFAGTNAGFSFGVGKTPVVGDVFGFAVDNTGTFSSKLAIWFRLNAFWLNLGAPQTTFPSTTPDQNASPLQTLWPATANDSHSTHTINTGQQAFAHAPPAGFLAWG